MIAFRSVPAGRDAKVALPLLDVYVDRAMTIPQTSLLDTGARGVRLSAEIARAVGVELPAEPNAPDVIVGGVRSQVHLVSHRLSVELDGRPVTWDAEVAFCAPWPHPFGLLGMTGFFDAFDLVLQGRDERFALTPRG
ncbi:MAG TPA: hypothetical protein VN238_14350 [Solirubrobacteraceae bacterium]|nr:hypothetical protein [Solirubrobacteraceae bacterium]